MFYTRFSRDLDRLKGFGRLIRIQGASGPQENEEVLHPNIFQQILIRSHFHFLNIFGKILAVVGWKWEWIRMDASGLNR